jgi:predicted DNA-binding transcriptional regulator YafY
MNKPIHNTNIPPLLKPDEQVVIDYTNWRGVRRERVVQPVSFHFETNAYHKGVQWLMYAYDIGQREYKMFAMANVHAWRPLS